MNIHSKHIATDALVKGYQQGNRDALRLLIKRFHPKLLKTIRYTINRSDAAEDIAQECWYAIIQQLEGLKLKISFDAWALTIARRKSIDWIREQQRERKHAERLKAEAVIKTDESENLSALLEIIHNGIVQLPPTQRIVLNLFYLENLNLKEISRMLGIPEGTVKSRLFTAREKLKEIIKKQNEV